MQRFLKYAAAIGLAGCVVVGPATCSACDTLYTPVVGWKKGEQGWFYPLTPLAGLYTGSRSGGWLFPLFSFARGKTNNVLEGRLLLWGEFWKKDKRSECNLFPLFSCTDYGPHDPGKLGRYGSDFSCLLVIGHQNFSYVEPEGRSLVRKDVHKFRVWPFWRYDSRSSPETGSRRVRTSILGYLFRTEQRSAGERNIEDFRSVSSLWRLFRYERSPDRGCLDILFVPLWRK